MTDEILREVITLENREATNEYVLNWAHGMELHTAHSSTLNNIKEAKDFDAIWQNTQMWACGTLCGDKCKYCSKGNLPHLDPCIWKEVWKMQQG